MRTALLVSLAVAAALALTVWVLCVRLRAARREREGLAAEIGALRGEVSRLREEDRIKADNRRESNARIDEMRDGDVVNNALDVLRKRKDG